MQTRTHASVHVPRPVDAVFEFTTTPSNLSRFMKPRLPIPGVNAVVVDGDGATQVGTRRRVAMSDGSAMGEEVTGFERPRLHAYRWLNPPKAPFSLLVRTAHAEWIYTPLPGGGGTRIDWTYTFELTTPLVYPLAALTMVLFRGWMQAALRGVEGAMP